eukprot:scaffold51004_cov61-Phaeocystis_antarctica.AAC.5
MRASETTVHAEDPPALRVRPWAKSMPRTSTSSSWAAAGDGQRAAAAAPPPATEPGMAWSKKE